MYVLKFADVLKNLSMCKCCVSVIISSLFIFFQLCCCFRIYEKMFKINNKMIEWWSELFSNSEFIMQCIMCYVNHEDVKTRFIVIADSWFFHVIMSDDVSRCNSVSLIILIKLSVMQCLVRHLTSSHQKWCRLKSSKMRCSSSLLSSCNKM